MTNTVTLIGFWCAIAMFAFGSAAVVRSTRRWRHNGPASDAAPFNSFAVLVLIPISAVITVAVTAKIGSTAGANPLTALTQDMLDSSATLGATIGAVLASFYALASVLIAGTSRSREQRHIGR